ncbi:rhomboid family intramembrane serine protease, partial [archaeon]
MRCVGCHPPTPSRAAIAAPPHHPLQVMHFAPSPFVASIQCLQPGAILRRGVMHGLTSYTSWHSMLGSTFVHGSDNHLYYNMMSLIWKGFSLERVHGSVALAAAVIA